MPLAGAIVMLVPLAVVPAVSLCTRPPSAELLARAFGEGPAAPPPA